MMDETEIENKVFPHTFYGLKISGLFLPTTIKHRWMHVCYHMYAIFITISTSVMVFGTLGDMISGDSDFSESVEQWQLATACGHIVYRGVNVMKNRNRIVRLLRAQVLVERWTNLRDAEEIRLIETSKISEYNLFAWWLTLECFNTIVAALHPLITDNPDDYVIYKSWLPCDRHVPSCYWSCWSFQFMTYSYAAVMHVSCDCLVLNIIERTCTYIRILQHRLTLLPHLVSSGVLNTAEKERLYMNECVLAHQNIYSTASEISEMFTVTTFIVFILTFSILCANIYLLSEQPLFTTDFLAVMTFLCCVLVQCLINCWYGYKLTQIGGEIPYTIFSMDWLELRKETRNTLRFMMLSASKSMQLFNNFIVELSPEMFLKIIKVSYSAYNLLKTQK